MHEQHEIFILAASEADAIVSELKNQIAGFLYQERLFNYSCISWEDFFRANPARKENVTLKDLIDKANQIRQQNGYAIILATYEDQAIIRNSYYRIPRDNVLLEYGLFCGIVGFDHTFLFTNGDSFDTNVPRKLPSDLSGIAHNNISREKFHIRDAARYVVDFIRGEKVVKPLGRTPSDSTPKTNITDEVEHCDTNPPIDDSIKVQPLNLLRTSSIPDNPKIHNEIKIANNEAPRADIMSTGPQSRKNIDYYYANI